MSLDRDMLATDLAELLSRDEYGIDVDSGDVKRGLDAFLDAVKPVGSTEAAARVAVFLREFDQARGHRTDEYRDQVAQVAGDGEKATLSADDLRVLVHAAIGSTPPRRSLREKLAEQGKVAPLSRVDCPKCTATPFAHDGVIQRHTSPETNQWCSGAGERVTTGA